MEQYCSKRGHRQYLKRGDVPTWPFYNYYGHRGVCSLRNGTLFIDRVFFGTHTKSGSVLLHFCMEILPCGWLNHEIGP